MRSGTTLQVACFRMLFAVLSAADGDQLFARLVPTACVWRKKSMLVNDHVVTDYLCNLRCEYCPCDVPRTKRRGEFLFTKEGADRPATEETISQFLDRNVEVIALASARRPTPVLKLS